MKITNLLRKKPFSIVGHRGAAGELPENTLKAFEYAIELGVDVVECDVRRTKDGNLIILHDKDFSRVAGVEKSPSEMTLNEIKKEIRIGGEEVPTLQEVISLVQGKCGLFIEIKEPETTDKVVETIEKTAGKTDWIAIISFYEEAIKRVGEISNISKGLIYSRPPGKIVEARELNCQIVLPRWQLATEKAVKFAHKLKLTVVAWTINDSQTLEKVVRRGVDAVATDYPSRLIKERKTLTDSGKFTELDL